MSLPNAARGRELAEKLERRVKDTQVVTDGRSPKEIILSPLDVADLKAAFGQGPENPPRSLFGVRLKIKERAPRGGLVT